MQKTNIILLLIIPLKKTLIAKIINILYQLTKRLDLTDIVKNKIILIKEDFITIKKL